MNSNFIAHLRANVPTPLIFALEKDASNKIINLLFDYGLEKNPVENYNNPIVYFTTSRNISPVIIDRLVNTFNVPVLPRHIEKVFRELNNPENSPEEKKKLKKIKTILLEARAKHLSQKIQNKQKYEDMKQFIKTTLGHQNDKENFRKQILQLAKAMNLTQDQKKQMWEDFLINYYTTQIQGIPWKNKVWAWWKKIVKKFSPKLKK